jgi:para-aminobenzoate synthetase component 1
LVSDGDGPACLAWGDAAPSPRPIEDVWRAETPPVAGTDLPGRRWGAGVGGAALIRVDYEGGRAPMLLPLTQYVRWQDGRCVLHACRTAELDRLAADLARPGLPLPPPSLMAPPRSAWERSGHQTRVRAVQARIAAGDCYQANLTLPFVATLAQPVGADAALFAKLLHGGGAPYAALLRVPGAASSVGISPECLLAVRGEQLWSCPIKGTRPRRSGSDAAQHAALLASAKERAELAMIIDMARNDLGRIAAVGSVQVDDAAALLDLPYVHHLVGRVSARLRVGTTFAEILAALAPAASITGAPKSSAVPLLARLEAGPRGPYCGAIGWLGGGDADLAVAIRTAVFPGDGTVRLHAGGGITADSDPDAEWDEVLAKIAPLIGAWAIPTERP